MRGNKPEDNVADAIALAFKKPKTGRVDRGYDSAIIQARFNLTDYA